MLRLWCELCVIVCSCFLDDSAERGPYLNTRKNKDSLQSNEMVSSIVNPMLLKISATACWLHRWSSQARWELDVERTDGAKEKSESWHSDFGLYMSHYEGKCLSEALHNLLASCNSSNCCRLHCKIENMLLPNVLLVKSIGELELLAKLM